MQQQDGRLDAGRVGDRRALHVLLEVLEARPAPLRLPEGHPDVARTPEAQKIDARRPHDGSLKAIRLPHDPGRHVAAVAVAVDPQALGVDIGPPADLIEGGQDVSVVLAAPVPQHRLDELPPVGGRAPRVDAQHQIPRRGQDLLNRVEGVVKDPVRPAVDVDHEGVLSIGREVGGEPKSAFDRLPRPLDRELLEPRRGVLFKILRVLAGEPPGRARLEVDEPKVPSGVGRHGQHHRPLGVAVEGERGHQTAAAREGFEFGAVLAQLEQKRLAPAVGQEEDPPVAGPAQLRRGHHGREARHRPQGVVCKLEGLAVGLKHKEKTLPERVGLVIVGGDGQQPGAVGRPRERGHAVQLMGPALGLAPFGRDDVRLGAVAQLSIGAAARDERDSGAVGGPDGGEIVPVAVRELFRLAALDPHDEEVPMGVAAPAQRVEAIAQPPHDFDLGVFSGVVVVGRAVGVDVAHHGQALPVGRPGEVAHPAGQLSERPGLAPRNGDDPELLSPPLVRA